MIGADQGWIDPWVRGLQEQKEKRENDRIAREEKDVLDGMLAEANSLIHMVRRTKPPRVWKLDDINEALKGIRSEVKALKADLAQEMQAADFQVCLAHNKGCISQRHVLAVQA